MKINGFFPRLALQGSSMGLEFFYIENLKVKDLWEEIKKKAGKSFAADESVWQGGDITDFLISSFFKSLAAGESYCEWEKKGQMRRSVLGGCAGYHFAKPVQS